MKLSSHIVVSLTRDERVEKKISALFVLCTQIP